MSETAAERAQAVQGILTATQNEPSSVKLAALAVIGEPSPRVRDCLWLIFVGGLMLALLASVVGLLWAALDGNDKTTTEDVLKVFTPLLAGVAGLFITSPQEGLRRRSELTHS